jgi:AraC family transcriptional regulator
LAEPNQGRRVRPQSRNDTDIFRRRPVLADWQVNLAKTYLRSRLSEQVSIADVAGVCGISACYFIKAFTETVGIAPYSWLIVQRVERACLLIARDESLAQVALECGFTDQSHFTKAFAKQIGMTPARWRQRGRR